MGAGGQFPGRRARCPRLSADPPAPELGRGRQHLERLRLAWNAVSSAYCASKFAVRGFTDSLRQELRGTGVSAATVHPGGVKTNIARSARYHGHPLEPDLSHEEAAKRFDAMARTTPERAAQIIHNGVRAGRSRIMVGPDAHALDALARLTPSHYFDVLAFLEPLVARR